MALKRSGEGFAFGTNSTGNGGGGDIISRSTQKRYGSEVEIVGGDGELRNVIYSGAEETITETSYKDSLQFDGDKIGDGALTGTGVLTRVSLTVSNEDLVKQETERLKITL